MGSEPLALAECAPFTSAAPVTLESAELVGPEWLEGKGRETVGLDQLQWPQDTRHGRGSGSMNIFLSTSTLQGPCCALAYLGREAKTAEAWQLSSQCHPWLFQPGHHLAHSHLPLAHTPGWTNVWIFPMLG